MLFLTRRQSFIGLCFSVLVGAIVLLNLTGADNGLNPPSTYDMASCADLFNIVNDLNGHYRITADIDCGDQTFYTIPGTFKGTLSGGEINPNDPGAINNIREIKNFVINGGGFFEKVMGNKLAESPQISNIKFSNIEVKANNPALITPYAVDTMFANIVVDALTVSAEGTGNVATGGLIAEAEGVILSNIKMSNLDINGTRYTGGLIGRVINTTSEIKNARLDTYNSVRSYTGCEDEFCAVGGLVGEVHSGRLFIMQSSVETGLLGEVKDGVIKSFSNVGGLVGIVSGASYVTIRDSYVQAKLEGRHFVGGIMGHAFEEANMPKDSIQFTNLYAAYELTTCASCACNACKGVLGNTQASNTKVKSVGSFYDITYAQFQEAGDRNKIENVTYESKSEDTMTMRKAQIYLDAGWSTDIWEFPSNIDNFYPRLKNNQ